MVGSSERPVPPGARRSAPPSHSLVTLWAVARSLLLVRHGQSTWNDEGRWQGQADPPLSALGEAQAAEAAARLAGVGFAAVASSDLVRARRTAEIVARSLALGPVIVEPRLKEYDVGRWCGLTKPEIEQGWPGMIAAWAGGALPSTPGGELRVAFAERVVASLRRLAGEMPAGDMLVVTHSGVVRTLERLLGVEHVPIGNLSGRWCLVDDDGGLSMGDGVVLLDPDHQTASPSR